MMVRNQDGFAQFCLCLVSWSAFKAIKLILVVQKRKTWIHKVFCCALLSVQSKNISFLVSLWNLAQIKHSISSDELTIPALSFTHISWLLCQTSPHQLVFSVAAYLNCFSLLLLSLRPTSSPAPLACCSDLSMLFLLPMMPSLFCTGGLLLLLWGELSVPEQSCTANHNFLQF